MSEAVIEAASDAVGVDWPRIGDSIATFGGDWATYCDSCYELYYRDFYTTKPTWPVGRKRFAIKRQPELDGQCHTFWHLVTEGDDETSRLPALNRCERICWPRLVLDEFASLHPASGSDRICWWKSERRGEDRYIIALADFSYVVVIADRGDYVLLWTAYPVEYSSRRRKLEREHDEFWRKG